MARINLDLSKFKSSGIYTLEFDQSESITLSSQTVRLVVGFSRKGPFNAPVYLDDIKQARKIFGGIDSLLEKRGSFFHRSLFTCLRSGPVFALNLMPLNNGQDLSYPVDKVDWRSFSVDMTEANGTKFQSLYSSFYNKQRFWTPDTEAFFALQESNAVNKGKILAFTNLGQTPVSIIIRKASVKGFDITATEWFRGNPPEWIRPFDFISDYFIEVIVVEGDWTNYANLAIDPIYSKYFDSNGIIKSQLNNFLTDASVSQLASFTGAIIPDLIDGENRNHYIETIINNNLVSSGIMVNVNQDALENYANSTSKVDMVGHGLINEILSGGQSSLDFLSYAMPIKKDYLYEEKPAFTSNAYTTVHFPTTKIDNVNIGGNSGIFENVLVINKSDANPTKLAEVLANTIEGVTLIEGLDGVTTVQLLVESIVETSTEVRIGYSHPSKVNEPTKLDGVNILSYTAPVVLGGNATIRLQGDFASAGPSKLSVGNIIMLQKPGWRYYYRAVSITLASGNTDVVLLGTGADFSGVDLNNLAYSGTRAKTILTAYNFVYQPDKLVFISASEYEAYPYSQAYKDIENGSLKAGDILNDGTTLQYIFPLKTIDLSGVDIYKIRAYDSDTFTTQVAAYAFGVSLDSLGGAIASDEVNFISVADALNTTHATISTNAPRTELVVSAAVGLLIKIGDYLVAEDLTNPGIYTLTKVVDSRKYYDAGSGTFRYTLKTNERVWVNTGNIMRFAPLESITENYRFTSLSGFAMNDFHIPGDVNSEQSQLEKILGVLEPSQSNIMNTLSSKDIITFRYIVDTFDGGLTSGSYPKNLLTQLAKKRQKCLALINTPSMKKFIKSNDPLFTDEPDISTGNLQPSLNTRYIVEGGNLSLAPSFRYSLPSEDDGAKFAGFFAPFLVVRESGKNILVPPAAYVSNLFIRKFQNGTPYAIVAGTRRGIIQDAEVIGLEYDLLDEDRDNLEPFGINPIIFRKAKGIMVYGNQSGYQRTLSALNSLHVRDLLITVEEAVEDILSNYVFEFNDSSTRLQIKSIIESYLSNVQSDGGIYAFSVTMDETNNTPDIIDQNVGIVDIEIEPAKGLHKIINRITITKTGGTSSGGFSLA